MAKSFNNSMGSYLAKSTKNRDFAYAYNLRRTFWQRIGDFFSDIGYWFSKPFKKSSSFVSSSISLSSKTYERVDLSGLSSDETFVIGGRPPSKFKRFWKRLKAAFKDDTPRVPAYNSRNQFSIKATRPSSYATMQTRRREMSSTVDLSAIAKTLEKGRIK